MAVPFPRPSLMGVADYLGLAVGLSVGFAVFTPIAGVIQERLARKE